MWADLRRLGVSVFSTFFGDGPGFVSPTLSLTSTAVAEVRNQLGFARIPVAWSDDGDLVADRAVSRGFSFC
jgi:hypothetical protein